jgi:hypothetical protein
LPTDPAAFSLYQNLIGFHSKITENALKVSQAAEADATAEYKRNENLAIQQYGGVAPQMLESKYVYLQQQQAQGIPISPNDKAFMQGYEQNKLITTQYKIENRTGPQGTMQLVEDPKTGEPMLFNTVTGQTQPAPGIAKPGTFQKTVAGPQKAINYATTYLVGGNYDGPHDEALMEQYFSLAKPETGFKMTQSQQDMLKKSQSWKNSWEAQVRHAATGVWFSDEQRRQIVGSMTDLARANGVPIPGEGGGAPGGAEPTAVGPGGHTIVYRNGAWMDPKTGQAVK